MKRGRRVLHRGDGDVAGPEERQWERRPARKRVDVRDLARRVPGPAVHHPGGTHRRPAHRADRAAADPQPGERGYGDQEVGTTSPAQRFTVGNTGNAATTDLAAALSDATHFTITANTCGQLPPGASCTLDVAARPASRGTFTAQLQVSAGAQAQSAALTVKGVQAVVVPESMSFGSLPVGQERVVWRYG